MKITRTSIAALALTGVVGLVAVPVLAQDATPTPADSGQSEVDDEQTGTGDPDGSMERLAHELAGELDLDVEDVTSALEAIRERLEADREAERGQRRADRDEARTQALDEAVADGSVTQEQADLLADLWAQRAEARDELGRRELTDDQRAALEAFRAAVGDDRPGRPFGEGRHGPGGLGNLHGHGRVAPEDGSQDPPAEDDPTDVPHDGGDDTPTEDDATVQESSLTA